MYVYSSAIAFLASLIAVASAEPMFFDWCTIDGQYLSFFACPRTCREPDIVCGGLNIGCTCPAGEVADLMRNECVDPSDCRNNICKMEPEVGYCRGKFPRYFYNSTSGRCEKFIYGGCGGNENNFMILGDCQKECGCPAEGQRYYDIRNGECVPCQSTCDSPLTLCRLACSSGCGCPENKFLDTKANACVVPKDCPQQYCWDGQYYASGESWRCSDGCNACGCQNGLIISTRIYCPKSCKLANGTTIPDGTSYSTHPCESCTCNDGRIRCYIRDCAAPSCDNYYVPPGECCPVCPRVCLITGQKFYNARLGNCLPCVGTCREPFLICERICKSGCGCPEGTLLDEEANACVEISDCPRSRRNCTLRNGTVVEDGTVLNSDPCAPCTCIDGRIACAVYDCLPIDCPDSFVPPGKCCPICPIPEECPFAGQVIYDGRSNCTPCNSTCQRPFTVCTTECRSGCGCPVGLVLDEETRSCVGILDCPQPKCPYKGQVYSACASACLFTCDNYLEIACHTACVPGCSCPGGEVVDTDSGECIHFSECPSQNMTQDVECAIVGQKYYNVSEGECVPCIGTCKQPLKLCTKECRSGCECPEGTLLDEVVDICTRPELCLPQSCTLDNGTVVPHGTEGLSSNPCAFCHCDNGTVICAMIGCAVPRCRNYYVPKGECCAVCPREEMCEYNGKLYNPGETFAAADGCNSCFCSNGVVRCTQRHCAPI